MADIDSTILRRLIEGYESGRLNDQIMNRVFDEPWTASYVFRDAKELWRTDDLYPVVTDDLRRAAWTDNRGLGERKPLVRTSDGFERQHDSEIYDLQLSPSGDHLAYVAGGRLYVDGEIVRQWEEVESAHFCDDWLLTVVEGNGLTGYDLRWPNGHTDRMASPPRLASRNGRVFAIIDRQIWMDGRPIVQRVHDDLEILVRNAIFGPATHKSHVLMRGDDGYVLLDGEPYYKEQMKRFGFLDDGTPFGVSWEFLPGTTKVREARLHVGREYVLTVPITDQIKTLVGHGMDGPFAALTSDGYIHLIQQPGHQTHDHPILRPQGTVTELRTCNAAFGYFVFIAKNSNGKKRSVFEIDDEGGMTPKSQAFASLQDLVVSPGGRHWAALAEAPLRTRSRLENPPKFVVVDGASGRIHDDVRRLVFASPTELRYLAKDRDQDGNTYLRCLSVQLS